jgi:hypothetical protein
MIDNYIYRPKLKEKLKIWYKSKVREDKADADSTNEFINWYFNQTKVCYYCGLEEKELQFLVMTGKLSSNRFPKDGQISRGRARGIWLEIDRKEPKGKYNIENCVLSCYFCNNDKSDIFTAEEYKHFFQNRLEYLKKLI